MVKEALKRYKRNDEYRTPACAITPLLPFLPKDKIYWEPCDDGHSLIRQKLLLSGRVCFSSGIKTGIDFLRNIPSFDFDIIITNPPFSKKTEFLERAFILNKPFAFLLPITTLEGVKRGELFRRFGIEVLVLDRRVNFLTAPKRVWFNSSWFCWKILPKPLIFVKL